MAVDLSSAVSRETVEKLQVFVRLFEKWNRSINLSAGSTLSNIWQRHVADSIQLWLIDPKPKRWLDLGSGGGFPGAITAVVQEPHDTGWVHLVESNQKKASFLRLVLAETGCRRATVHARRVEDLTLQAEVIDAVSARALADLPSLLNVSAPWLEGRADVSAWFHKGRDYRREIEAARSRWRFDLIEHVSKINAESAILQISNLKAVDPA